MDLFAILSPGEGSSGGLAGANQSSLEFESDAVDDIMRTVEANSKANSAHNASVSRHSATVLDDIVPFNHVALLNLTSVVTSMAQCLGELLRPVPIASSSSYTIPLDERSMTIHFVATSK